MKPKYKPLILALDEISITDALKVVDELHSVVDIFKLNSIVWDRQLGTLIYDYHHLVNFIHDLEKKVFLDMKFHDIPTTMESHAQRIQHSADFFTFHLNAGRKACESMSKYSGAMGVSLLTSLSDAEIREMYSDTRRAVVDKLVFKGICGGITQFVVGCQEVGELIDMYPEITLFVPGVSLDGKPNESQQITTKWDKPIRDGAGYIIMGRSILSLPRGERRKVIEEINAETEQIRNS